MSAQIAKLRQRLKEINLDALIISYKPNVRYISDFTGSSSIVYISQKSAVLITDFRYVEQAKGQTRGMLTILDHKGKKYVELNRILAEEKIERLAIEAEHVSLAYYNEMKENLLCQLVESRQLVEELRRVKSEEEVEKIMKAAEVTDRAFDYFLQIVTPGLTEKNIANKLEYFIKEQGCLSSFDIIVASGSRGALPHGHASDKVIEKNEFITLDFGVVYEGYCSDMTRTICVGKANEEMKKIYNIVLEAQLRGIDAVKVDAACVDVDCACRDYIIEFGYGEFFGHGTGHGIGIEGHELPYLNRFSNEQLKENEIVTIEPGIYIPNVGGVRIEDDIIVKPGKGIVINQSSKEFISL
jgi:Xaa-Pro aminopeptidase